MKKIICFAISLLALMLTPVFGQPQPSTFVQRLAAIQAADKETATQAPPLTKFNLAFPGGTPKELVAAIEKATGKPLNVIIRDEDTPTQLPPMKLSDITFPQLSDTLKNGSTKQEYVPSERGGSYVIQTGYYFRTTDDRPTDSSVWFFYVTKKPEQLPPPPIAKICQFYSLAPYLDRGFTVDDITTAIQTGWKMSGDEAIPELNYHKETKMLIAYGEPGKLSTISMVLQALPALNMDRNEVNDLRNAANSVPGLLKNVSDLQSQVAQLNKEISAMTAASTNLPAANPGK